MNNTEQTISLTAEQINEVVKKLGGNEGALSFLRGETEIQPVAKPIIINCDADPHRYNLNHCLRRHQRNGKLVLNFSKIELLPWEKGVTYEDFLRNLPKDRVILNSNVLDYLLSHRRLIPESWESKYRTTREIVFMGTIFFDNYRKGSWFATLQWSYNYCADRMIWEQGYHEFRGDYENSSSVFVPVIHKN
ncbi:MAG TPA: hypothetical protein PLP46_02490 [bacterium]|nr:hypothetical protein [bacterium]